MGIYLSLLSVILLGLVAGLLLALWFQLRAWKAVAKDAPLLTESLTSQLIAARSGLAELKKALVAQGPDLERLISDAGKARVELQFLLQRSEDIAQRLDNTSGSRIPVQSPVEEPVPAVRLAENEQPSVMRMASSRRAVMAYQAPTAMTEDEEQGDPLEELLAGLNQAAATPLEDREATVRRKRVGPITQAELDLQEHIRNQTPFVMKKAAA